MSQIIDLASRRRVSILNPDEDVPILSGTELVEYWIDNVATSGSNIGRCNAPDGSYVFLVAQFTTRPHEYLLLHVTTKETGDFLFSVMKEHDKLQCEWWNKPVPSLVSASRERCLEAFQAFADWAEVVK